MPPLEGLERIRYYTNSTLLELTELPEHLAIVGGSYIALEFAQMFRRFGSRVTVIVRGERVLAREDADFAQAVQKVLAREGIEFRFGAQPQRVEPHRIGERRAHRFRAQISRASKRRICCSPPAASRIPTTSVSTRPASRWTSTA